MTTKVLDHGFVRKVNHGNNDLTVVNAARVSMGKEVSEFVYAGSPEAEARKAETGMGPDDGLIKYLAKHNHWTPFAHVRFRFCQTLGAEPAEMLEWAGKQEKSSGFSWVCHSTPYTRTSLDIEGSLWGWVRNTPPLNHHDHHIVMSTLQHMCPVAFAALGGDKIKEHSKTVPVYDLKSTTLHMKLPIFVARQLMRSNVGIVYNEVSRRYVDDEPWFYWPDVWRARPSGSIKQGSGSKVISELYEKCWFRGYTVDPVTGEHEQDTGFSECDVHDWQSSFQSSAQQSYEELLVAGVAPEQARIILPQSTYTELWMTASHDALRRLVGLREDPHAQWEIRQYAEAIREACPEVFTN